MTALLLTLEHPGGWAVALAGFLARGGIVAFLLPIVTLPTPAGLQARLAPLLVPIVFGEFSSGAALLLVALVALAVGGILIGGLVGAWSDVHLIRRAAAELGPPGHAPAAPGVATVLGARLLAHAPLAVAFAWGAGRIADVAYRELTTPFEVVTPLAIRIVAGAPDAIVAVGGAWLLGEAAGGLGAREVVERARGPVDGAVRGWAGLVRRPLRSARALVLTSAVLLLAAGPGLVAAGVAWGWVRRVLWDGGHPAELGMALAAFVGLWLGALVLTAVAAAFRSNAWTVEWRERAQADGLTAHPGAGGGWPLGTIGDAEATRPGG